MAEPQIQPHKITKPIQLLAVWLAALVILVGAFLTASGTVSRPPWLGPTFGVAAVVLVPMFLILIFVMQTKFRPQLQADPYYADWTKRQEEVFIDFRPENLPGPAPNQPFAALTGALDDLEQQRIKIYESNCGLFLVHTWRPSATEGQIADIAISLRQHGNGPLDQGKVKCVEYELGRKFFPRPVVKKNAKNDFRLDVSAYGPMLCLARVQFSDGRSPINLERYIDF